MSCRSDWRCHESDAKSSSRWWHIVCPLEWCHSSVAAHVNVLTVWQNCLMSVNRQTSKSLPATLWRRLLSRTLLADFQAKSCFAFRLLISQRYMPGCLRLSGNLVDCLNGSHTVMTFDNAIVSSWPEMTSLATPWWLTDFGFASVRWHDKWATDLWMLTVWQSSLQPL